MATKQGRTREEAETWIPQYLEAAGGSAEGSEIRDAAQAQGFHERTLRRAAVILEEHGVLFRSLHGVQSDRGVTWSLAPIPESQDCEICGHSLAVHGLRGLACRRCPSLACTKREESSGA